MNQRRILSRYVQANVHLFVCSPVSLSLHHIATIRPSPRQFVRPSVSPWHASVHPYIRQPFVRSFVRLSICPSDRPSVCSSVRPFVRLFVCSYVLPSALQCIRPSVRPIIRPSFRPTVLLQFIRPSAYQSIRPTVRPVFRLHIRRTDSRRQASVYTDAASETLAVNARCSSAPPAGRYAVHPPDRQAGRGIRNVRTSTRSFADRAATDELDGVVQLHQLTSLMSAIRQLHRLTGMAYIILSR